jgi:hypothetical protein
MSKLTPEAAWKIACQLFDPKPVLILRQPSHLRQDKWMIAFPDKQVLLIKCNGEPMPVIDWGDLTRYPPEEPQEVWRDAVMPQDWGKPARFNDARDHLWTNCELAGQLSSGKFVDDDGVNWDYCQVRVDPNEMLTK